MGVGRLLQESAGEVVGKLGRSQCRQEAVKREKQWSTVADRMRGIESWRDIWTLA